MLKVACICRRQQPYHKQSLSSKKIICWNTSRSSHHCSSTQWLRRDDFRGVIRHEGDVRKESHDNQEDNHEDSGNEKVIIDLQRERGHEQRKNRSERQIWQLFTFSSLVCEVLPPGGSLGIKINTTESKRTRKKNTGPRNLLKKKKKVANVINVSI